MLIEAKFVVYYYYVRVVFSIKTQQTLTTESGQRAIKCFISDGRQAPKMASNKEQKVIFKRTTVLQNTELRKS